MYDAIIVGGGPAGLSAALVLGRARRRVLLCDSGSYRNEASHAIHGFLSRDGIHPGEFLQLARDEVTGYGVEIVRHCVVAARGLPEAERENLRTAFQVKLETGRVYAARKLLLATGVADLLPEVEGIREFCGKTVHHCPYCNGWEHRDQRLAAFGHGSAAVGLALSLRTWSEQVTACTHGVPISSADADRARRNGIAVREELVVRLTGSGGRLQRIEFAAGPPLECDAMFYNTGQKQRSNLPAMLGCQLNADGHVRARRRQRTSIPGLFLAGDAGGEIQFAVTAAAKGAIAATALNRELQDEDCGE